MPKGLVFIVGLVVLMGLGYILNIWWNLGNNVGYSPEQPLPFSHQLHAGVNQIPCQYCHSNVDEAKHASIPSMNVCMNCHKMVKTDSPHIQKLTKMYQENQPIEWVKIHDLPDFVFFNHKRHIKKGIDCSSCHGSVEKMEKIEQVETLQMGFCMNCHREKGAPVDCYTCHH